MSTTIFRTRAAMLFGVVLSMLASTRCDAATICVTSANDFAAALAAVSGSQGSNEIRIVSGIYDVSELDVVMADASNGDLKISGNWESGCVGAPGFDARATVISGGPDDDLSLIGERRLELQALTFSKFLSLNVLRSGAIGGHAIRLDGLRLARIGSIAINSESAGPIDLRNLLVQNSGTDGASCALRVGQDDDDGYATTLLAQSTFAFNTGAAQVCLSGNEANKFVRNSIFDGLDINQASVDVATHEASFIRNRIQMLSGVPASTDSFDNFNDAPGFVDAGNADFRLAAGSPAIGRGYMVLPEGQRAFDLHGNPRWHDVRPDLGAIETTAVHSDVITVNTANDTGFGSLREAIGSANANADATIIRFNLPNGCSNSIKLESPLPLITAPVWIDGYSQPLSAVNSSVSRFNAKLCLRIEAMNAGFANVFRSNNFDSPMRIEGIGFGGFAGGSGAVVMVHGAYEAVISGNQFGGTAENGLLAPNLLDISVASGSRNVQIGGPQLRDRNLFTNALGDLNVAIGNGVNGTQVLNNWFGMDSVGLGDLHSAISVELKGNNSWLLDNRFAFTDIGILISGAPTHNRVQRNTFGLEGDGSSAAVSSAIAIYGGVENVIGAVADQAVGGNVIAGSLNSAITISQAGVPTLGYRVRANSMIGTRSGIDIDLLGDGPTPNDPGDVDAGPNLTMNHPLLSAVAANGTQNSVVGSIVTTAGPVLIDFYASNDCGYSGRGQSAVHLGSVSTSTGAFQAQFTLAGDPFLSATATDANGNTGELSPCNRAPPTFSGGFE